MRTSVATTQFDQPNLTAGPATPSCCCCCCCCLTTIVSTSVIAGGTVNAESKMTGGPNRAGAVLLAVGSQFVGFGLTAAVLWLGMDWPFAVLAGLSGAVFCWYAAFQISGTKNDEALRRAVKYLAIYAAAFALEFVVGFALVIMYVIPYLLAGILIGGVVIRNHRANIHRRLIQADFTPDQGVLDEAYLMDAPPTGPVPTSPPRSSVTDQPLPGAPRR